MLTIHGRTREEKGQLVRAADWAMLARVRIIITKFLFISIIIHYMNDFPVFFPSVTIFWVIKVKVGVVKSGENNNSLIIHIF